jgi:hypothetical protein
MMAAAPRPGSPVGAMARSHRRGRLVGGGAIACGIVEANHRGTEAQRQTQRMSQVRAFGARAASLRATSVPLCLCGWPSCRPRDTVAGGPPAVGRMAALGPVEAAR